MIPLRTRGLVPKFLAGFRPATGPERCDNCAHMRPDGTCTWVIGQVRPDDTCRHWRAA